MHIALAEPTSPRYIYVNPTTNLVHLMMPVVSGAAIGLDNTCKSVYALQGFFGKSYSSKQMTALNELILYKAALEFDMSLITDMPELAEPKKERLDQINHYIELIKKIECNTALNKLSGQFPDYPAPLKTLMSDPNTNLYSMVLRPTVQDSYLRSVNPVFSVKRSNDKKGNPNSLFYQMLHDIYRGMTLVPMDARARLIAAVVAATNGQRINFESIQLALSQKARELLGVDVDFTKMNDGADITQAFIDKEMGFDVSDNPTTTENYVDALLGYCTPTLFDTLPESPFHMIKTAEKLSIATQFFLATVNIYCRAQNLSSVNFGEVLDASSELSSEVAARVASVLLNILLNQANIEECLLDFVNTHQDSFQLTQALTSDDMAVIKKQFTEHFAEIKDSPHFDEFMVFDSSKSGQFINHQGCICTDFCAFLAAGIETSYFIQQHCRDYKEMSGHIEHKNEWIADHIELNIDVLSDEQLITLLEKLRPKIRQEMIQSYPERIAQLQHNCVAKGQQAQAEEILRENLDAQRFLLTPGEFTDYSGRTFNCTAYEYAYWAKDAHMCRMLERHMNDATKADMSMRIDEIERIDAATALPVGLVYSQGGLEHRSAHFDLTPLKDALREYSDGCDNWYSTDNQAKLVKAWLKVGLAQRDVPAHVAQEYCRQDHVVLYCGTPSFNIDKKPLPRTLAFLNTRSGLDGSWYPLAVSPTSGLGFEFALMGVSGRELGPHSGCVGRDCGWESWGPTNDLIAINHLDKVRDEDLKLSRKILLESVPEPSYSPRR